jgi:hypothetical protein
MMVDPPHSTAKRGNKGVLIEIAVPVLRAKQVVIEHAVQKYRHTETA